VLHPGFKTTYFETQNWPAEWIAAARTVLIDEWDINYKPSEDGQAETMSNVRQL
ncbi:hypothetical protein DFH11DRAFT_1515185, partial [Phellopilus nigrolimitatus]